MKPISAIHQTFVDFREELLAKVAYKFLSGNPGNSYRHSLQKCYLQQASGRLITFYSAEWPPNLSIFKSTKEMWFYLRALASKLILRPFIE